MKKEEWKAIPGYEGSYEASTLGRIRSLDRLNYMKNRWGSINERKILGRVLKGDVCGSGYFKVTLCQDGKKNLSAMIHRLIAITFISNPEGKKQVNHINGIKTDNKAENLEWISNKENIKHSRQVLKSKGKRFTIDQVIEIIKLSNSGMMTKTIAKKYKTERQTISAMLTGYSWYEFEEVLQARKDFPPRIKHKKHIKGLD